MERSPEAQLGARIRQFRKRAGLSISQLAAMADLDTSFLNQVELGKGNPSVASVGKIAKALRVPLSKMFEEIKQEHEDIDYKISSQVHSLVRDTSPSQKDDLLVILRVLRNHERLKAFRKIIRG